MRFAQRTPAERAAIGGWIRVCTMVRENACLKMSDSFKQEREKNISETPGDISTMLRCYGAYQQGRHTVSYTQYFQVSHPAEYAAILLHEKKHP